MGHDAVAVLDGGWQAWVNAGGATASGEERPRPRAFSGTPRRSRLVTLDEVASVAQLVDARAAPRLSRRGRAARQTRGPHSRRHQPLLAAQPRRRMGAWPRPSSCGSNGRRAWVRCPMRRPCITAAPAFPRAITFWRRWRRACPSRACIVDLGASGAVTVAGLARLVENPDDEPVLAQPRRCFTPGRRPRHRAPHAGHGIAAVGDAAVGRAHRYHRAARQLRQHASERSGLPAQGRGHQVFHILACRYPRRRGGVRSESLLPGAARAGRRRRARRGQGRPRQGRLSRPVHQHTGRHGARHLRTEKHRAQGRHQGGGVHDRWHRRYRQPGGRCRKGQVAAR